MFKKTKISDIGTFQDGALKHNNPSILALWESRKLWPSVAQPDVFVLLGTGTSNYPRSKAPKFRHIYRDGFIPRLLRSFSSLLDGQRTWQDLINSLNERFFEDFFRLNIVLAGKEHVLDDVSSMDSLRERINSQPLFHTHIVTVFALSQHPSSSNYRRFHRPVLANFIVVAHFVVAYRERLVCRLLNEFASQHFIFAKTPRDWAKST